MGNGLEHRNGPIRDEAVLVAVRPGVQVISEPEVHGHRVIAVTATQDLVRIVVGLPATLLQTRDQVCQRGEVKPAFITRGVPSGYESSRTLPRGRADERELEVARVFIAPFYQYLCHDLDGILVMRLVQDVRAVGPRAKGRGFDVDLHGPVLAHQLLQVQHGDVSELIVFDHVVRDRYERGAARQTEPALPGHMTRGSRAGAGLIDGASEQLDPARLWARV